MDRPVPRCAHKRAPSGVGKTTIVCHLVGHDSRLAFSISACTRDKRGRSEAHGQDYYFISVKEFRRCIEADELFGCK